MSGELTVPELFTQAESLLGKCVIINAVLVLRGGECYLVPNLDSHDASQRIEVYAPGLEEKLNASVAGWVGGPAIYFDTVKITGVLRLGTTRRNRFSVCDTSLLVLYRDDEVYKIILD